MRLLRVSLALLALVLVLLARPSRLAAAPLRAVVRVAEPHDRALLERMRGQTSDLAVRLVTASTEPLEPRFRQQLATARALAEERGAGVAIWCAQGAQGMVVYVVDLEADRVFARALERGDGARDASALDEAAALVVRSALRASLAGAALETPEPERVAQAVTQPPVPVVAPPPPGEPTPPPKTPKATPIEPPQQPRRAVVETPRAPAPPRALWLGLGAEGALDGFETRGRYALEARLFGTFRRLEAGLSGTLGLPVTRSTAVAEVSLAQHRAGAFGGIALLMRDTLRLSVDATLGALVARTRVRREVAMFRASEQRAAFLSVGAELRLAYAPDFAGGRLAIAPSAGFIALPTRPVIGYRDGGSFVRVQRLHVVQPVLALALLARF